MSNPLGHMTHRDTLKLRADLEIALERVAAMNMLGYPQAAIDAELAMALYRAAITRGLHQTGVEASLNAHIERLEGMLAKAGHDIVRGGAAAAALTPPPVANVFADPPVAGHDRATCGCGDCVAERKRIIASLGVR